MNLNQKIILSLALVAGIGVGACRSSKQESKITDLQKHNIVCFLTDDLGYGDLSCYDQKTLKTPKISWMVVKGIEILKRTNY